jgi:hypothetical protein
MTDHKDNLTKEVNSVSTGGSCVSESKFGGNGCKRTLTKDELRSSDGEFAACEEVHIHVRGSLNFGKEVGE